MKWTWQIFCQALVVHIKSGIPTTTFLIWSEPLTSASHRLFQLRALDDSGRDIAVRDHAVQVDVGCEAVQVLRKQDLNQIIGGKRSDRRVDG